MYAHVTAFEIKHKNHDDSCVAVLHVVSLQLKLVQNTCTTSNIHKELHTPRHQHMSRSHSSPKVPLIQ